MSLAFTALSRRARLLPPSAAHIIFTISMGAKKAMNTPADKPESETERYNREAREKPHPPTFATIEEEAEFWQTHDSEDFYSEPVEEEIQFVPARRSKAMAVRLEPETYAALEKRARALGVGPSTLTRMWILEHLQKEAS